VEHAQELKVQFPRQLLGLIQIPVIAAHHDNGGLHVLPPKLLEDLNAADLGHHHVDENDIIVPDFMGMAGRRVFLDDNILAQTAGQRGQNSRVRRIAVNDDNTALARGRLAWRLKHGCHISG
jgi:hypothetical protein